MAILLRTTTAGSALIQACEKAGVTIPRCVTLFIQQFGGHELILDTDTATMSKLPLLRDNMTYILMRFPGS